MSEHRIGRIFAYWAFFSLGIFLKMTGVAQFFEPLFISTEKVLHSCWQKNCFGYILGIFSQTHLVTLLTNLFQKNLFPCP
jgi:hypothetical protein